MVVLIGEADSWSIMGPLQWPRCWWRLRSRRWRLHDGVSGHSSGGHCVLQREVGGALLDLGVVREAN